MNVSTPNKPAGLAGLWQQIGAQLATQPLLALGLACIVLLLVLGSLRALHRMHPALAGFLTFLILGLVVLHWTSTRTEPAFLKPLIDGLAPFFPAAPRT